MYCEEELMKGGVFAVAKISVKYKFNNQNSAEDTADILLKLFVEANKPMVEEVIKNKLKESTESHSA